MMSSALTWKYAERTSESKTTLGIWKSHNRKRDSEAYESFVSVGFYFGFLGTIYFFVDPTLGDSLRCFLFCNWPLS